MNRSAGILVTTLIAALLLGGCGPLRNSPYYVTNEDSEGSSVTSILSRDGDTPLIQIASYEGETPVIHVYPNAAPGIAEVESVEVGWESVGDRTIYSLGFKGNSNPMQPGLGIIDTDRDGIADQRIVMFPKGAGFRHYFDFNADGILDAYTELNEEEGRKSSGRAILVDQRWVAVVDDEAMFKERRTATALDDPETTYFFEDGVWQVEESSTSPE